MTSPIGATIGSLQLEYDVHWVTKFQPPPRGQANTAIDGSVVIIRPASASRQVHTFRFTWVTQAQLTALEAMAATNQVYTCRFHPGGSTVQIIFATEAGSCIKSKHAWLTNEDNTSFSHEAVTGTPADAYSGEFTAWVVG